MSESAEFENLVEHGLGQLTRPLGNRAGTLDERLAIAVRLQDQVQQHSRFGIPAIVHEECLTGLQLYGATTYPTPLAWGSSWDVDLVRSMATQIGQSMRALGIHLGLAPVLDVVRDPRWGRVEECISEDPYLIGVLGTAYVEGVQSAGVGATPKHFLGYSNSRAGRNLAPVHAGPREILEVFAVPFEMVVKQARPSAIMHSYAEIDGVPVAADRAVLTELLRERWGFDGVVVADYFGVSFLPRPLHDVAADAGDAAALALTAGVDVELPTGNAYLAPLAKLVADGTVSIDLVDQATRRVLDQKARLGLLSGSYKQPDVVVELDPQASREIARELGERSIVLLDNELLPLASEVSRRIAVIGPNGDAPEAMMGNYSFTNHIVVPEGTPLGINVATVADSVRTEFPGAEIRHAVGCAIRADHETEADAAATIAAAVELARDSDVCVAVVGDRAGLFGRGTVGEGSDTDELELPGRSAAIGRGAARHRHPGGCSADHWTALSGRVVPGSGRCDRAGVLSGGGGRWCDRRRTVGPDRRRRLSVSIPRHDGGQPYAYRHPRLGGANAVSNIDPAQAYALGHGLSYTTFERDQLAVTGGDLDTTSTLTVRCRLRNTGSRAGRRRRTALPSGRCCLDHPSAAAAARLGAGRLGGRCCGRGGVHRPGRPSGVRRP